MRRGLITTASAFAASLGFVGTALAVPNGGTVTGRVELPQQGLGDAPVRNRGFLERERYPLKKPAPFDPREDMVVFLEGGPVARADKKPTKRPVLYRLVGEGFESTILPVVTGSEVELKNRTKTAPELYSPTDASLIRQEQAIFNPDASRLLKNLSGPFTQHEIRARDSAHLRGLIVTLPTKYFSKVGAGGKFEVRGVPSGVWRIRVWHRGGWVKMNKTTVTVRPRIATNAVVHLPRKLESSKPGEDQ